MQELKNHFAKNDNTNGARDEATLAMKNILITALIILLIKRRKRRKRRNRRFVA